MQRRSNPDGNLNLLLNLVVIGALGYIIFRMEQVPWEKVKGLPFDELRQSGPSLKRLGDIIQRLLPSP